MSAKVLTLVCGTFMFALVCSGCGHTQTARIGLISLGDLEGKTIPENPDGPILQGTSAARPFKNACFLSDAVRDALKSSEYDTLIDAEVTTETGLWVSSNKITVKGKALDSKKLPSAGGDR